MVEGNLKKWRLLIENHIFIILHHIFILIHQYIHHSYIICHNIFVTVLLTTIIVILYLFLLIFIALWDLKECHGVLFNVIIYHKSYKYDLDFLCCHWTCCAPNNGYGNVLNKEIKHCPPICQIYCRYSNIHF